VPNVLGSVRERGRVVVAVDGIGASGKSTFAIGLAEQAGPRHVVLLHVDDYFNPADVRHARGRLSAEGFWLDTYNYHALISWALEPLGRTGSGLYRPAAFDRATGASTCPDLAQAPADALVIVEGVFLHRDELARFWDYSVFLDVPVDEANRRMTERGGLDKDLTPALLRRYNDAQALYFARARPWERASVVIDNTDPTDPTIIDPANAHAAR
jgi:uridine kinase